MTEREWLDLLEERWATCNVRYQALPKDVRIKNDLYPDIGTAGFSGTNVLLAVSHTLKQVRIYGFPVPYDRTLSALSSRAGLPAEPPSTGERLIQDHIKLEQVLGAELHRLEDRLAAIQPGTSD